MDTETFFNYRPTIEKVLSNILTGYETNDLDKFETIEKIMERVDTAHQMGVNEGYESAPKVAPVPHKKAQMTGSELTIWRKKKGWNQSELGKKLGRSGRSVRRFEDSKHIPIWVFNKTETM